MHIPFVSLKKYDGQVMGPAPKGNAAQGSDQGVRWAPTDDAPSWAAGATEAMFGGREDRLETTYRLDYPDINGLGNNIYRLDGKQLRFCLKVLGDAEGNQRETAVWELLGYGEAAAQKGIPFNQIKGLPPKKFTTLDKQLRTVLTPYYPGVLKAISGGAYEFPLVITAALSVEATLTGMHQQGLAYMDLCPSNILFNVIPSGAMLFFLTDMGGVKPLRGHEHKQGMDLLLEHMVGRRWTRREVLPPAHLFPTHEADPRLEPTAAYDDYTLGRTCQLLLGMGPEEELDLSHLDDALCLEDPIRPTRQEMEQLMALVGRWMTGETLSEATRTEIREGLQDLFCDFFLTRQKFAVSYLADEPLGQRWQHLLQTRLQRYRMALPPKTLESFKETLAQMEPEAMAQLTQERQSLDQLVDQLRKGQWQTALEHLQAVSSSKLVEVSRLANYSLFHHKKLMRGMFGGKPGLREGLAQVGAHLTQRTPMASEPEAATCKAARQQGSNLDLGVLKRTV